jgi:hypothetical protein
MLVILQDGGGGGDSDIIVDCLLVRVDLDVQFRVPDRVGTQRSLKDQKKKTNV